MKEVELQEVSAAPATDADDVAFISHVEDGDESKGDFQEPVPKPHKRRLTK